MKPNIQSGIIAATLATLFSFQLITLNSITGGIILTVIAQYSLALFLFLKKKFAWWIFVIIYGFLSIILFVHVLYFLNINALNLFALILTTAGVLLISLKRDIRSLYFKKKELLG